MSVKEEQETCQHTVVQGCGRTRAKHYLVEGGGWGGHTFIPPPAKPTPAQIAPAVVVTVWTCPSCRAENDVHGEGAVYSWMECGSCHEEAWLVSEYDE